MTDDCNTRRVKEIYDAYEQKRGTRNYNITLTPLNGAGDIDATIKCVNIHGREHIKNRTIRRDESLEFIGDEFYFE